MLKKRIKSAFFLVLLVVGGFMSGICFERGIFQTPPTGKFFGVIPDSMIAKENHEIDSFGRIVENAIREADSLRLVLSRVRKEKKAVVVEYIKEVKPTKEINKELKAIEERYSVMDSSLIFSVDSVLTENPDGTVLVKRDGLRVIQGLIAENKYQLSEINKLDSIVRVDSTIIQGKDSIIYNILARETKKENYYLDRNKKQENYYQKRLRKRTLGTIGSAILGILIGKFLLK